MASPWNFPYAIPAGGVLAALMAGNTVILKPPPETRQTAWLLANQCWRAGVPRDVLQYVACPDDEVGQRLITHDDVATVVLTGAYATAQLFLDWKPRLRLLAETSGKNAIVVTEAADMDAAIRDVVRSAFGHAGQKCSAASLLILTAPVYDDDEFLPRLAAAVRSVRVGEADDPATMMAPLIAPPSGPLLRGLTALDPGERWLVEPRERPGSRRSERDARGEEEITSRRWTPGVRIGVAEGSWFHQTECFGPVLGVMRADDLAHAVRLQNGTPFGLTGGIQSLDDDEIRLLAGARRGRQRLRQPPHHRRHRPAPAVRWLEAVVDGRRAEGRWAALRTRPVAPDRRAGRRRRRHRQLSNGVGASTSPPDRTHGVAQRVERAASPARCGRRRPRRRRHAERRRRGGPRRGAAVRRGGDVSDAGDGVRGATRRPDRFARATERCGRSPTIGDELAAACHALDIAVDRSPVSADGLLELPHWLREQAISQTMHRYGSIRRTDAELWSL